METSLERQQRQTARDLVMEAYMDEYLRQVAGMSANEWLNYRPGGAQYPAIGEMLYLRNNGRLPDGSQFYSPFMATAGMVNLPAPVYPQDEPTAEQSQIFAKIAADAEIAQKDPAAAMMNVAPVQVSPRSRF